MGGFFYPLVPSIANQYHLFERLLAAGVETTVLFVLVWLISKWIGTRQPRVVAWLWIIVCLKPAITLLIGPAYQVTRIDLSHLVAQPSPQTEEFRVFRVGDHTPPDLPPLGEAKPVVRAADSVPITILLTAWVVLCLIFSMSQWKRCRQFIKPVDEDGDSPGWLVCLNGKIAAELGLVHPPDLRLSHRAHTPMVTGVTKPTVILPRWMLYDENRSDLVWSLRHEMTHIRHYDLIVGHVLGWAQILFFWLPPVWVAHKKWREAIELACDRAVTTNEAEALAYADFLYRLTVSIRNKSILVAPSTLAVVRSALGKRIEAMLRHAGKERSPVARGGLAAFIAFAVMSASIGAGIVLTPPIEQKTVELERNADGHILNLNTHQAGEQNISRHVGIRGPVLINPADGKITSIGDGGVIALEEIENGQKRSLHISGGKDNNRHFEYMIDGEQVEVTDATRLWYQSLLRDYATESK